MHQTLHQPHKRTCLTSPYIQKAHNFQKPNTSKFFSIFLSLSAKTKILKLKYCDVEKYFIQNFGNNKVQCFSKCIFGTFLYVVCIFHNNLWIFWVLRDFFVLGIFYIHMCIMTAPSFNLNFNLKPASTK